MILGDPLSPEPTRTSTSGNLRSEDLKRLGFYDAAIENAIQLAMADHELDRIREALEDAVALLELWDSYHSDAWRDNALRPPITATKKFLARKVLD